MDELEKLTVAELKEKLTLLQLPTSGNKAELVKRLIEYGIESASETGLSAISTSSTRALAAAKRAALRVKQQNIQKMQELQLKEFKLKQEMEAMQIENELEVAVTEEEVLQTFDHMTVGNVPLNDNNINVNNGNVNDNNTNANNDNVNDNNTNANNDNVNENNVKALLEAIQLPKSDHLKFDGNPLHYCSFINSFNNLVGQTSINTSNKLNRLIECCTGSPKQMILGCAAMTPEEGYRNALYILEKRFGDSYHIAEAYISDLLNFNDIPNNDPKGLQIYSDKLATCLMTLRSIGYLSEISSQHILAKLASKLPPYLKSRWVRSAHETRKNNFTNPNINYFVEFVCDAAAEANDPIFGTLCNKKKRSINNENFSNQKSSNFRLTINKYESQNNNDMNDCILCPGSKHVLFKCSKFKSMSVNERVTCIRKYRLCFNCLKHGHLVRNCMSDRVCTVNSCGRKHSNLVHVDKSDVSTHQNSVCEDSPSADIAETSGAPVDNSESLGVVNSIASGATSHYSGRATMPNGFSNIALPIVPVKVRAQGCSDFVTTYALLDTGSTHSFCSDQLRSKLNVKGSKSKLSLTTLNNQQEIESFVVKLEVKGVNENEIIPISNVYSQKRLNISSSNIPKLIFKENWPHLKSVDIPVIESEVQLLIGQDVPRALMPLEIVRAGPDDPYAIKTALGWVLNGPIIDSASKSDKCNVHFVGLENNLEDLVKQFWKVDGLQSVSWNEGMSIEDQKVIKLWGETTCKRGGHYEMDIPFKKYPPELKVNYDVALRRLNSLKLKLSKDFDLKRQYCIEINELLRLGYAERVPEGQLNRNDGMVWYLPHHAVVQPQKGGKIRVVFDCASRSNGQSLNDNVMQGPDFTNKLLGILLRFRQGNVGLIGDIKGMFHQVKVNPEHRDVLRFLWWPSDDMEGRPVVYRMTRHLFGGRWCPSCCSFALQKTVKESGSAFSQLTVGTIARNFYVDDCVVSFDSEDSAAMVACELIHLLEEGGFCMTKFISNSPKVMKCIPEERRSDVISTVEVNMHHSIDEKALGVFWSLKDDCLKFKFSLKEKPPTRRGLLSMMSSVYDPYGFLNPFMLKAKKLVQKLFVLKLGWDELIPERELQQWLQWKNELPEMNNFKVPRCFRRENAGQVEYYELHNFADASMDAYGVVSYLRIVYMDGTCDCMFVMSKLRLAPIKTMTVPRLELAAAAMAVQIDGYIREHLDIKINKSIFWSDSMIVLQYINNQTKRFHVYVSNRIALIHDGSKPEQWHHIESSENPADDITRGLNLSEIAQSRWITGPEFLRRPIETWKFGSNIGTVPDGDPEVKATVHSCEISDEIEPFGKLVNYFSSWLKLRRSVAWFICFSRWLKYRTLPKTEVGGISTQLLNQAHDCVIKYVQGTHFEKTKLDSKNSKLKSLNPFLDEKGLIRVGGRLQNSTNLSFEMKYPLILPKESHVTKTIVHWYHESLGHSGVNHVHSELRNNYWVINGNSAIRNAIRKCVYCRRQQLTPSEQKMADLPIDRISESAPFTNVGVDYFGPFLIKNLRKEQKRYGVIFTCLASRAVHLEVANSLDMDSFINAIRRFMARRGPVKLLRSDNGTNFVAAERELRENVQNLNTEQLCRRLQGIGIEWKFNPPKASHFGGVWERLIRSCRRILNALMADCTSARIDDESFNTLICEVERVMNSRPLTVLSEDSRDLGPLTPSQLLTMKSNLDFCKPVYDVDSNLYSKRRWKRVQHLAEMFWLRWKREYLCTLQERRKWLKVKRNFQIGDIVLLKQEDFPRNLWPLAMVDNVIKSTDGLVRSVQVRHNDSVYTRPISKIILLIPVND